VDIRPDPRIIQTVIQRDKTIQVDQL